MTKINKTHESQLKSLLNRIQTKSSQSSSKTSPIRPVTVPVDEASTAIGKQIAHIFTSIYLEVESSSNHDQNRNRDLWRNQGYEIMNIFGGNVNGGNVNVNVNVNAGVVSGFFHELSFDERLRLRPSLGSSAAVDSNDFLHWWLKCISICEESGYTKVLHDCIRGYVSFSIQKQIISTHHTSSSIRKDDKLVIDGSNDPFYLANLYHKCKLQSTRQCLLRECIHAAFHSPLQKRSLSSAASAPIPVQATIAFLSPLFYTAVVSSSLSTIEQHQMASLFLSLVLQESRLMAMRDCNSGGETETETDNGSTRLGVGELIAWLTTSLGFFFASPVNAFQTNADMMGIGIDFTCQLCELCVFASMLRRGDGKFQGVMSTLLNVILGNVLPKIVLCEGSVCIVPSLQPVLKLLITILSLLSAADVPVVQHHRERDVRMMNSTIYNIGIMCMSMQNEADVALILRILCLTIKHTHISAHRMVRGVLCSLGYMFRSVQICSLVANDLLHRVEVKFVPSLDLVEEEGKDKDREDCANDHVFDLFHTERKADGLLGILTRNEKDLHTELSSSNQCESLLLGLSLVCIATHENSDIPENVYAFLKKIISTHNHLGRRCLPVLVATLEKYIASESSNKIVPHLEFICSSVAQDSSCAHEIWSILCSMTSPSNPVPVQSMAVRLYPILCKSNKRLYSRVRESLGRFVSHPNVSLRVSAAATICDLAKDDLIRDVTDVIGSVQSFLLDDEVLVVHFAVLALHYLIVAEELDYSMVIKVLNKKLVEVGDAQAILKLPDVVVNAIVKLMGNGEASDESSDDDEADDTDHQEIVISEQVQASTSGLRHLALVMSESIMTRSEDRFFDIETTLGLLSSVYESLSKYSFNSIGIMSSEFSQTDEYKDMKRIVELAYEISEKQSLHKHDAFNEYFVILARRLVLFEEDCLGPLLWKHSNRASKKPKPSDLPSALKTTPQAHEGTLTYYLVNKLVDNPETGLLPSKQMSFECLQVLSLPVEFVEVLETAIDADEEGADIAKASTECCVDTLIAQLRIERRSAVERREYLRLYVSLAQLPPQQFFSDLWMRAPQFLGSLGQIIPQWTTSDVAESIPKLWSICTDKLSSEDGVEYAISFLKSMYSVLERTHSKKTSPTLVKAVHKTLVTVVFPSVCDSYKEPSTGRVQEVLYGCIAKIPRDELLEYNILTFGKMKGADICRIQLIAYLQHARFFQRGDPYLLRAALWIGKQDAGEVNDDLPCYWKASFQLTSAASTLPMDARKEFISTIFESMLINGVSSLSLQVILQCAIVWVNDATLQYQALIHFDLTDSIELATQEMKQVQLQNQQIGNLSMIMDLSTNLMKRSLSLLETMSVQLKSCERETMLIFDCLASIFLALKNQSALELQHALASTSLCSHSY